MKLILFGYLVSLAVSVDVNLQATNITDSSSSSSNPQFTIKNEIDRETPVKQLDSRAKYYTLAPYYTTLVDTPWRRSRPLASSQTRRGTMFDMMKQRMNSFWEGRRIFGMLPLFRTALSYFFFGDNRGQYPVKYGPDGPNSYGRYRPDQYTPLNNNKQFNALPPPSGSPYYNNQFAQSNQPSPVGAPPYSYQSQSGAPPPYTQSQPSQSGIQTTTPPYNRGQPSQPNVQSQSLVPASSNVQPVPITALASGSNGKRDTELQLEIPSTLSNSRNQGVVLSGEHHSQPVHTSDVPNAHHVQQAKTNVQPQYVVAG